MDELQIGQRIQFKTRRQLMAQALYLSSEGYGVAQFGYHDMYENILTITALPEQEVDHE